jgi:putative redox protein
VLQTKLTWNEKMRFTAAAGTHEVLLDAKPPLGQGRGANPKRLLLSALCGCTAMDVVALLRKHGQELQGFEVHAEATPSEGGHPAVFTAVDMAFHLHGPLDPAVAVEAVRLSQTRYCGVSAMLSRALPIRYEVFVNGASAGKGQAEFTSG